MPLLEVIEGVAWEYLPAERQAQLKTLRPDIFGYPACERCIGGQVVAGECLQCNAQYDQDGNWLEPHLAEPVNLIGNKGAGFHKRKFNIE